MLAAVMWWVTFIHVEKPAPVLEESYPVSPWDLPLPMRGELCDFQTVSSSLDKVISYSRNNHYWQAGAGCCQGEMGSRGKLQTDEYLILELHQQQYQLKARNTFTVLI